MYDLIIIGGGMSGISVGQFFRNWNILLLEKGDLLAGATGSNAGFLITGFGEHFFRTARRWGVERASEIQRIHLASHRRIRDLTNRVELSGSFSVAMTDQEASDLRSSYAMMRANGFQAEWIEDAPTGLRNKQAALFNPDDGLIESKQFWKELSNTLPCRTNTAVLKVIEEGESLRVLTTAGEFRGKHVVYCLNAYSGELLPELNGKIIPLRGQMVELQISSSPPCTQPVMTGYGEIYWNFSANALRFGGLEYMIPDEEVGIASSISAEVYEVQMKWIQTHLDVALSDTLVKTWYGTMGFTVDGFPLVGELPGRSRQYILAGMCGLGHSYVMECSAWLYEWIANAKNRIPHYFSSDRILNLPEYTGGNWRTLYEAWNH